MLKLYNYLTGKKEKFVPIKNDDVRMFVCGPTVQDYMHLGHARTYVFFDMFRRYLVDIGYGARLLINVTDIDESIERAAGASPENFIEKMVNSYKSDMQGLRIERLYGFERVSKYIPEMIRQISVLMERGYAYTTDEAVFFDTSKVDSFGELTHLPKIELELRPLELSSKKRNLLDFTLWRNYKSHNVMYSSPWGDGWPGWHIQDTALAISVLGTQYDIHGGAYDLIYPHHVSEIAQAEALTGKAPYVKYWIYTGFVTVNGEKMSKSAGNSVYVKDVLSKYDPSSLRFYLLSEHYSKNIDYNHESLATKSNELKSIREKIAKVDPSYSGASRRFHKLALKQIENDFNTPKLAKIISDAINHPETFGIALSEVKPALVKIGSIFGVDFD
ncbi:MAG: cysteine--tRNA ligase [Nitrososphaerota archaeon]|nr:cysteine--tRNA ligase [Nitrososphaerota archaeon]MDG6930564.1 cysteine--tRNA ligase [Nitrososphaerota archaeon]